MSERENVITSLKELVSDLVNEEYDKIIQSGRIGRLTEYEVKNAITEYGGMLTLPSEQAFESEALRMRKLKNYPEYSIAFDLWIDNERSDLSLTVNATIDNEGNVIKIEMQDIHIL